MTKNKSEDFSRILQGVIDTAIDGIITIDSNGIIESFNQAASALFLYRSDEVIGKNVKILMSEPHRSQHDQYINRYLETKQKKIIGIGREVVGLRKDGSSFPLRLAVSEVLLNDRVIFTGIIHDLTELNAVNTELHKINEKLEKIVVERTNELESVVNRLLSTNSTLKKREKELNLALLKEKELNELKSRFVSMASHEFRTPLSTVMSSAILISKYTDAVHNENRVKHVSRIKSAVNNLTGILNDFLSLSKLDEGKVDLDISEIDVAALIETVKDEVSGLLKDHQNIKIISEGQTKILLADQRILKNILFNLISNAIKYSDKNVECLIQYKEDCLHIHIIDFGIGIPDKDQKHLFGRFFRASNVETIQGTGLGLNIVKRYIDLLKGKINYISKEGEGSNFKIELNYFL